MRLSDIKRGLEENVITQKSNSIGGELGAFILKTLTMTKVGEKFILEHERSFSSHKVFLRITRILNLKLKWMIIHSLTNYFMQLFFERSLNQGCRKQVLSSIPALLTTDIL